MPLTFAILPVELLEPDEPAELPEPREPDLALLLPLLLPRPDRDDPEPDEPEPDDPELPPDRVGAERPPELLEPPLLPGVLRPVDPPPPVVRR